MKTPDGLRLDLRGSVAWLSLDREPRNLLVPELMDGLRDSLLELDARDEAEAIVLTGAGDLFCGGLDVPEMRSRGNPDEFATAAVELLRVFPGLGTLVVAAVNGDALALGYALVCSSDLAVAADGARLGTFEASLGIWPMTAQVPALHRLAPKHALENIFTGNPFDAQRAREVGVVNAVVPRERLEAEVSEWVDAARRAGAALGPGRRSAYRLLDLPYDQALDEALAEFKRLFGSPA